MGSALSIRRLILLAMCSQVRRQGRLMGGQSSDLKKRVTVKNVAVTEPAKVKPMAPGVKKSSRAFTFSWASWCR